MSNASVSFPRGIFRGPSELLISPSALALAKAFSDRAKVEMGPTAVVAFYWFDDRRTRTKGTNDWTVHGPGFDLAAWDETDFPGAAIWRMDGLSLAVGVPLDVLNQSALKRIDVTTNGGVALL